MLADARKFLALESREKCCMARAVAVLWRVRIALWLVGYRRTRRWVERRMAARSPTTAAGLEVATVARMVSIGARFVPRASCLVKALAAELLLRLEGHESELHIGVRTEKLAAFEAHAWLEIDGNSVIGGEVESDFISIYRDRGRPS